MRILIPTFHVRPSAQAVPLAAGCLRACLTQPLRRQTLLLDLFPGTPIVAQAAKLLASQPRVVAFPLYLWNRGEVLSLCRELRRQQPELFLLAGGPEASADSARVIAEGQLDGVICGEGEQPFAELMQALSNGNSTQNIPGFRSVESVEQPPNLLRCCPDLSQLASPWLQGDLPLRSGCGVLWEIARGCHFNCAFCYDAKGHQGVRGFPEERLRAELELFVKKQVSQIWVLDSTFNAPPERGKGLLNLLLDFAPDIHFHLEAKADFLDEETAELLSGLSCSVQIGLQSADPKVLEPLHRSIKKTRMEQQLGLLNDAGITFGLDLIYGLPGDNFAGFCSSLDFALAQQPNQVDIFPLAVMPGTELFQQQQRFGISADSSPPYLIRENRSFPAVQLKQSRTLAAATDLFYNRGRAVGFFQQLCDCLSTSPSQLLKEFAQWLVKEGGFSEQDLLTTGRWQPSDLLPLQVDFAKQMLLSAGLKNLLPLCSDLIHYHYFCAELLLAHDCRPAAKLPAPRQWGKTSWKLNPQVRVHQFHFDLEELEMRGGQAWRKLIKQLSGEPSYGIFLRHQGELVIETLQPDFGRLLLAATGRKTAEEFEIHPSWNDLRQLFKQAVREGVLVPVI